MCADKVSYSFNAKINTGNYESLGFNIFYETDVQADENPSKALRRAQRFVEKKAEEKLDEFRTVGTTEGK